MPQRYDRPGGTCNPDRRRAYLPSMKKLFFLASCLLLLTSLSPRAHAGTPDVIVVRVLEMPGTVFLAIARNGRPNELLEFSTGYTPELVKKSGASYQKVIQQLYQEGYALQGSFASGHPTNDAWVTMIFVKPQ